MEIRFRHLYGSSMVRIVMLKICSGRGWISIYASDSSGVDLHGDTPPRDNRSLMSVPPSRPCAPGLADV